jgi:hypothetical protein
MVGDKYEYNKIIHWLGNGSDRKIVVP